MPQSESISKLVEALVKVQTEFTIVPKNKQGQEGNRTFKYADLADVMNMALPKLNKHGIFLSQPLVLEKDGEHLRQTTRLQLGDEFIQSDGIRIRDVSGAGKQLGIEVTYARRIDLNGALGISPDEDIDAPDLKPGPSQPSKPASTNAGEGIVGSTGHSNLARTATTRPLTKVAPAPTAGGTAVANVVPVKADNSPTSFNFGANVPNTEITDDDIPSFDTPVVEENPLPPDAQEVADHLATFVPLTEVRNAQIQGRLQKLVTSKILDRRKLAQFLEAEHGGKKAIDVPAPKWEATIAKIDDAVKAGDEAIKDLLKTTKKG